MTRTEKITRNFKLLKSFTDHTGIGGTRVEFEAFLAERRRRGWDDEKDGDA